MEEGYVLVMLRQVRKLLSIQVRSHECLIQGSGHEDEDLQQIYMGSNRQGGVQLYNDTRGPGLIDQIAGDNIFLHWTWETKNVVSEITNSVEGHRVVTAEMHRYQSKMWPDTGLETIAGEM